MIKTPSCSSIFCVESEQDMSTTMQSMHKEKLVLPPSQALQCTMNLRGLMRHAPPIYRLPTETLARIFELGTHATDDPIESMDFTIRVAAVSRRFRDIACSTPRLWTTLSFYSPRPSWYNPKSEEKYYYTYTQDRISLERSRVCPLDLIMCYRDMSWSFNEVKHYFRKEHMEHILSIIAPHSHRIRRLTLICDTFAPLHATLLFLAEHGARMKALETLELYRCNEYAAECPRFYPHDMKEPIPLLGGSPAPKLARVVLAGVHVAWFSSEASLSNLKSLELTYHSRDVRPSLKDFACILQRSPKLENLTVIGSGPISTDIASPNNQCVPLSDVSRIRLSSINTLHFGYYNAQDAMMLLQLIDAPYTTDLTIADVSRPAEDDVAGGSSIMRSLGNPAKLFPRLESLSLDSVKSTSDAFSACLHALSGLRELELDGVSREVLSVLTDIEFSTTTKNLPCPALKHISLRLMSSPEIGTLAKARATAGMPLESLSVYYRDSLQEQEIEVARRYSQVDIFGSEDEVEESACGDEETLDPYELGAFEYGGAFNDPEFDAMYMP